MLGQLIIEALAVGLCYGMLAIALVIIYKTSYVLNFAQGDMAMMVSFVSYHILFSYHVPFWLAFVLSMLFAALLGVLIEFCFLRPAENPTILGLVVITLGVALFLMGIAAWKWGPKQRNLGFALSSFNSHEPIKGVVVSDWDVGAFVVSSCLMVLLYLFFRYSRLGVSMRAVQQNKSAAKTMGIRVKRVYSFAWGISSIVGATAGMFFCARASLDPNFMMENFIKAFAAAVLGGLLSIPGVVLGGVIVGLIENLIGYVWPTWKPIVAFLIIVVALCIRPSGLFAKHYEKKV